MWLYLFHCLSSLIGQAHMMARRIVQRGGSVPSSRAAPPAALYIEPEVLSAQLFVLLGRSIL